jgi:hydroxypyruvate isomerase
MEPHFIFVKLSRLLTRNKIIAARFDFWGSGESEGEFQEMNITQEVEDGMKIMDFLAGCPSVNREHLGVEVPVGKGEVDFPLLISRLKEKGFKGPITIEEKYLGSSRRKIY